VEDLGNIGVSNKSSNILIMGSKKEVMKLECGKNSFFTL